GGIGEGGVGGGERGAFPILARPGLRSPDARASIRGLRSTSAWATRRRRDRMLFFGSCIGGSRRRGGGPPEVPVREVHVTVPVVEIGRASCRERREEAVET